RFCEKHQSSNGISEDNGWPFHGHIDPAESAKELGLDPDDIDRWLSAEFVTEEDLRRGVKDERRTRAILVIYKGRLIAERYGLGANHSTPLLGWSMTKSLTNTLLGLYLGRKHKDLAGLSSIEAIMKAEKGLFDEWRNPEDEKYHITMDD